MPAGAPELDVVELERITARQLEEDAAGCGLQPEPLRVIAETDEHTGSEVVMLRV